VGSRTDCAAGGHRTLCDKTYQNMKNPAFNLAASLVERAADNMPQPDTTGQKMPIMDDEDAIRADLENLMAVADGAIQTAREQQARADQLHRAVAAALLFLARHEPDQARTTLDNALDAELQPTKPDPGPVPF